MQALEITDHREVDDIRIAAADQILDEGKGCPEVAGVAGGQAIGEMSDNPASIQLAEASTGRALVSVF